MKNLILLSILAFSLGSCFMGVSMPHGQKPGIIIGLNMGIK